MAEEKEKTVHDLELHESIQVTTGKLYMIVTRVPGGWIYGSVWNGNYTSSFVPLTNEGKQKKKHTRITVDPEVH